MKQYNDSKYKFLRRKLRNAQTKEEKMVWNLIRNKKINDCKFYRQYSVGKYILDFYCPKKRLCIEIDGGQHNDEKLIIYDKIRSEFLESQDIKVIRFWNNDVRNNIAGVYEVILTSLIN